LHFVIKDIPRALPAAVFCHSPLALLTKVFLQLEKYTIMDKVKSFLCAFLLPAPVDLANSDLVVAVEAKIRTIPPTMRIPTARLQPTILAD
jgi:hypothetical protein